MAKFLPAISIFFASNRNGFTLTQVIYFPDQHRSDLEESSEVLAMHGFRHSQPNRYKGTAGLTRGTERHHGLACIRPSRWYWLASY